MKLRFRFPAEKDRYYTISGENIKEIKKALITKITKERSDYKEGWEKKEAGPVIMILNLSLKDIYVEQARNIVHNEDILERLIIK